jgi:hypothetical protein
VSIIIRRPWTQQVADIPRLNRANPLTRGLVFCGWPVGNTFLDLVTNEFGVNTGTLTRGARSQKDGRSRRSDGSYVTASTTTDKILWSISTTLRGASANDAGTILALAGTTTQTDAYYYPIGGNAEGTGSGHGFSLGIDSFKKTARGNIVRGNYIFPLTTAPTSSAALLGNPFDNRTHFFGYSFTANGASGTWLGNRIGETWTGGTVFGTSTTNRRASMFAASSVDNGANERRDVYIGLQLIWDRALSVSEYQALYDNPWQLFAPRRIIIPSAAAAAGIYTLSNATYAPGSLTATAVTPRVTVTVT